jgi:hypothetical protein
VTGVFERTLGADFATLHLDLHHDTLAIEGIAVGVIRNLHARA